MLKHLILCVDYTTEWERAMSQLPALLKRLGTRHLTLAYVIETHKRQQVQDNEGSVSGKLKSLAEDLSSRLGVQADYQVGHGFVASKILEIASLQKADGIVVCNASHSAGRELFMGNSAVNLARMTRLPLLILPANNTPSTEHAPLIFATDGSEASGRARQCFEALVKDGSEGMVLWVRPDIESDQVDEVDRQVHELANQYLAVHSKIQRGQPVEVILETISKTKPALTILGKRGNTPIPEVMLGSVSRDVARGSTSPVLLVP